jgi:CheY-like chemotaxis protein
MMIDILSFEGYPIQVARNGQEALEKLRIDAGYLVFLDLMMPTMDGWALCQQLDSEPALRERHIVVIVSALDNLEDVAPLHADVIMPKPFSVDDVMNVIEPFMQHS